jgi:hypothetical protein
MRVSSKRDFPVIKAFNLLYIHKQQAVNVIYFTAFFRRKIVAIIAVTIFIKGDAP